MKKVISLFLLLLTAIILFSSYYIVKETEQVVLTRIGKPIGSSVTTAGVHFKLPLIDTANFIEKRILEWDGDPRQITTRDKKYIMIDATARWQIQNPLTYLLTTGNDLNTAFSRLDGIIDSSVRDTVSNHDLIDLVRNSNRIIEIVKAENLDSSGGADIEKITTGREAVTREILKKAEPMVENFGIKLVDVRIKGIMYKSSVLEKVYDRMISERSKLTEKIRSEGLAEKARIEGKQNLDLKTIESEAYKKTQEIKGQADAEASAIFAKAYGTDPELYGFLTSLDSGVKAIHNNTTLIFGTDTEFFKVYKNGLRSTQTHNPQ
jgi:membrane protease subunit HflC